MKLTNPKERLNILYKILWSSWIVEFKTTRTQDYIFEQFLEHKRIIVLKGRQIGASTLSAIICLDMALFIKEKNIVITCHNQSLQVEIFKKIKLAYDELVKSTNGTYKIIENWKTFELPKTVYNTTTEISFTNNSNVKVVLEGSGYSMSHWAISELSKNQRAEYMFTNTLPALGKGTMIIESTAYWTTGTWKFFYDLVNDSVNWKNDIKFVFIPWFWEDKYEEDYNWEPIPSHVEQYRKFLWEYSKETQDRKLWWYTKMQRLQKNSMKQEMPSYWEEAFLSSGTSVFDFAQINKLRKDPLYFDWDTKYPKEAKDVDEGLRIYNPPAEYNVTAIDPAGGNENWDYTAIEVRDYERRLLAHYYGKAWPEKTQNIIRRLDELGYKGLIVPEINAQNGGRVYEKIMNDIEERVIDSEMYRRKRSPEDIKNWIPTKYAWDTNTRTRKDIIENYIDLFDREVLDEIDDRVLNEMTHFYENDNWKKIATEGEHDDGILCSSICLWVVEQEDKYIVYATDRDVWL